MRANRWAMVYSNFDFDITNQLYDMMSKAQGRFGIKVEEP